MRPGDGGIDVRGTRPRPASCGSAAGDLQSELVAHELDRLRKAIDDSGLKR